jgi:N utilization substance protein B
MDASRRQARERALEILYEAEIKHEPLQVVIDALGAAPDNFCLTLLEGTEARRDASDQLIEKTAEHWPLDRIGTVDRLILELAIAEMLSSDRPSNAVIINEAVELAKRFSTEQSGGFINGILAAVANGIDN